MLFCWSLIPVTLFPMQTVVITEFPPNLIVSLNRFQFDRTLKKRVKVLKKTHFSANIQLPLAASGDLSAPSTLVGYELCAIVVHSGTTPDHGHYFTYARDLGMTGDSPQAVEEPWLLFNDGVVTESSGPKIMSNMQAFPSDTPYLLFFRRLPQLPQQQQQPSTVSLGAEQPSVEPPTPMEMDSGPHDLPAPMVTAAGLQALITQALPLESPIHEEIRAQVLRDNTRYLKELASGATRRGAQFPPSRQPPRRNKDDDNDSSGGRGGSGGGGVGGPYSNTPGMLDGLGGRFIY